MFWSVFNKTIILLALVGYQRIIANSYPTRAHGIIVKYMLQRSFSLLPFLQHKTVKTNDKIRRFGVVMTPLSKKI